MQRAKSAPCPSACLRFRPKQVRRQMTWGPIGNFVASPEVQSRRGLKRVRKSGEIGSSIGRDSKLMRTTAEGQTEARVSVLIARKALVCLLAAMPAEEKIGSSGPFVLYNLLSQKMNEIAHNAPTETTMPLARFKNLTYQAICSTSRIVGSRSWGVNRAIAAIAQVSRQLHAQELTESSNTNATPPPAATAAPTETGSSPTSESHAVPPKPCIIDGLKRMDTELLRLELWCRRCVRVENNTALIDRVPEAVLRSICQTEHNLVMMLQWLASQPRIKQPTRVRAQLVVMYRRIKFVEAVLRALQKSIAESQAANGIPA